MAEKICGIISAIAACMAVIALRRKDRTEFFGTGQAQKIGFKDYVDVISHNRAIQMLVVNASTDKLASSMMSSSVIMVMLYGIICGNYAQYGLMSAATSIPCPRSSWLRSRRRLLRSSVRLRLRTPDLLSFRNTHLYRVFKTVN